MADAGAATTSQPSYKKYTSLRAITFNVLHPVHGQNWDEFPMRDQAYYEPRRVAETLEFVLDRVKARRSDEVLAFALQEVSEWVLEGLHALVAQHNAALAGSALVHAARCSWVPTLKPGKRRPGYSTPSTSASAPSNGDAGVAAAPIEEPEYEVVVLFGLDPARAHKTRGLADGDGDGKTGLTYASVDVPECGLVIASTHLAYGVRRRAQLRALLAACGDNDGTSPNVLVLGDYNCTRDMLASEVRAVLVESLVDAYAARSFPPFLHVDVSSASSATRVGKTGPSDVAGAETIDHALMLQSSPGSMHVCPVASVARVHKTPQLLSDHRPVEFIFDAARG